MRLLAALTLLALADLASAQTQLRTAAQMGSDPKFIDTRVGSSHAVGGFCIDLYRAIEHVDPSLRIVGDQDWRSAPMIEELLTDGRLDVGCALVRSPERERQFHFIEPRVLTFNYRIVSRADDAVQVQDWDDIRKLEPNNVVLANHGWGYVHQLDAVPGLHLDTSAYSPDTNLQKLVAGHGRFFYYREPGLNEVIYRTGLSGKVRVQPGFLHSADVFMAMRTGLPASVVSAVQQAVSQLDASGELAKLAAKWN